MKTANKFVILVLLLVVALVAMASQVIRVREAQTVQTNSTANAGELTAGTLVGQTFVADTNSLSGVAVMFATYSNRANTKPVEFHLRSSAASTVDLRVATVDPQALNDNQFYRFDFPPLTDSKGQTYFFFVTSPASFSGNAVTVDINTQDPYHLGSAYIAHGPNITVAGKPTIDLAFQTYHTVPLNVAITHQVISTTRWFVQTWDERRGLYVLWTKLGAPTIIFLLLIWYAQSRLYRSRWQKILLGLLFVAALALRLMYAQSLPFTDDEGNYLYDAHTLLTGHLAGGDGYVKAPLVIIWVALWQLLFGHGLLAGRLASVVISALTMYPIYFLGRAAWGRRVGLLAAGAWALCGASIVFGIYVHTQPLSLFFAISGLATLYLALRGLTPRLTFYSLHRIPSALPWFMFVGALLGLGVASRKSILAVGLVPLVLIILKAVDWKMALKHLVAVGFGFTVVVTLFIGAAYIEYGRVGVIETLGINSVEDSINANDPSQLDQVRAYSLHGMTPFFRESLPLIFLATLGLGFASQRLINRLLAKQMAFFQYLVSKLAWIIPVAVFYWAWWFFRQYEGAAFMFFGVPQLWYGFAGLTGILALWYVGVPRPVTKKKGELPPVVPASTQQFMPLPASDEQVKSQSAWWAHRLAAILFGPLWLVGLILFYSSWIKFHPNYIAEFIPPLVLLAGYGALAAYRPLRERVFFDNDYPLLHVGRRLVGLVLTVVIFWSMFVSNYITYVYEHTGTFQQDAVAEAAAWARENIPLDMPIFTGAALIPYVSGHQVALNIAHPRWYAYEFTRTNTTRLNTFLPPAEKMLAAFRSSQWFLMDKQTGFSYLMEYSEIEQSLARDFMSVKGISNGSNTLTFYKRIHSVQ